MTPSNYNISLHYYFQFLRLCVDTSNLDGANLRLHIQSSEGTSQRDRLSSGV